MTRYSYDEFYVRRIPYLKGLLLAALCLFGLSSAVFAQEAKTILFVYNPDVNTGEDGADEDFVYLELLEDTLGYNVQLIGQNEVSPADTAGVDAIFFSESVGSGTIVTNFLNALTGDARYGNIDIPIITPEVFIWDDMLWIQTGPEFNIDQAWGFANADRINIRGDHPILGGLRSGPISVYDAPPEGEDVNQVGYGVPQANAQILATVPGSAVFQSGEIPPFGETRASLFTYDEGDVVHVSDTLTVTAAARRVGFFAHTRGSENLSTVGRQLFKNAIAWAVGDEDLIQEISAQPATILFVYNPDSNTGQDGNDEDFTYLTLLEDSLGFNVQLIGQDEVTPADTAGVDAIFISESVGSGSIVTNFLSPLTGESMHGNVRIPLMTAEVFIMDDMQWIRTGPDFGIDTAWGFASVDFIEIADTTHPILGGLQPGENVVYSDPPEGEDVNQVGYGVPWESATILATVPGEAIGPGGEPIPEFDETRATLFLYEVGDTLVARDTLTIVTPARRAAFFAHTRGSENLNESGQALFMNTILWLTGQESEVRMVPQVPTAAEGDPSIPESFAIESVYPNPFNPTATALLSVTQVGEYEVNVYDLLGRLVQRQMLNVRNAGRIQIALDLREQASGVYLIRVSNRETGQIATANAVLLK